MNEQYTYYNGYDTQDGDRLIFPIISSGFFPRPFPYYSPYYYPYFPRYPFYPRFGRFPRFPRRRFFRY
jgi:hypothetical protein